MWLSFSNYEKSVISIYLLACNWSNFPFSHQADALWDKLECYEVIFCVIVLTTDNSAGLPHEWIHHIALTSWVDFIWWSVSKLALC